MIASSVSCWSMTYFKAFKIDGLHAQKISRSPKPEEFFQKMFYKPVQLLKVY